MVVFGLSAEALRIPGGHVMLIALRMIFPSPRPEQSELAEKEDSFIVPLALPLIAGTGVIAAIMVLTGHPSANRMGLSIAVPGAWVVTTLVLLSAQWFAKVLRQRGLMAMEPLMGMLLIVAAVQTFPDGLHFPSQVP